MLLAIIFSIILSNEVLYLGQRPTTNFEGVSNTAANSFYRNIYPVSQQAGNRGTFVPSSQNTNLVSNQRSSELKALLNDCLQNYGIENFEYCKEFALYYGYTLAEIDNSSSIFTAQINHNMQLNNISNAMAIDGAKAQQEMYNTSLIAAKDVHKYSTNIWSVNSKYNLVSDFVGVPTQTHSPWGYAQRFDYYQQFNPFR